MLRLKRRRDFKARRWQFLAVALTITLGVMMFAASYDGYLNLESSYTGTYERLVLADMTVTGADDGFAEAAAGIAGVAAVTERREIDLPFRVGERVLEGRAIGMPPDGQPEVNQIDVVAGSYLDPDHPNGIVIETHLAEDHGLEVGDTLEIFTGQEWQPADVIGIAVSPEYLWPAKSRQEVFTVGGSFGVAFVTEQLLDPLPATAVAEQTLIEYDDAADVTAVDARVTEAAFAAGAADVQTLAQQPSNSALQLDVDGFQQLAIAFPLLFLIAAGMAAFILLTRLVYSQRPQIGTLRALGVSRPILTRHYLSYGLILGTAGAVVGVIAGVLAGFAMTGAYTAELGIPDTVRELHPVTIVVGLLFGVIAGAVAAFLPARAAFHLSPAEEMRGEAPAKDGHRSLFERLIPPLRRTPVRWRMVLRGIGREKRRSLSTVIGVVLALVLILVSWGLIDTVNALLDRQFNDVNLEDASAVFAVPVTGEQVDAVAAVDGVASSEDVVTVDVSVRANSDAYSTQLVAYRAGTELHGFVSESGTLPASGVVTGSALAEVLDVSPGDEIILSFPTLGTSFTTTLEEFADEPMGTSVYMERSALEDGLDGADPPVPAEELTSPAFATVGTLFAEDADREIVLSGLDDVADVAAVIDQRAFYDLAQDLLGFFFVFVGVMLLFGGLMAFALIFNTISVNVAERSTEYATMRANGLSQRKVANLIMGENMLLTAIGIIPGLIIGWLVAAQFMGYYSSDMFQFDLEMSWTTLVFSAVFMLVVAAISLWPGIRSVRKIDVAEVVRERAV